MSLAASPDPSSGGQALVGIAGFVLVTADLPRLVAFYTIVLGLSVQGDATRISDEEISRLGLAGSGRRQTLSLGQQTVTLEEYDPPGRAYPPASDAASPWFQHLAIVVEDIGFAHGRLLDADPITRGGPQQLPASSGGVQAFKFRDPDGHPLELLQFPGGGAPAPWQNVRSLPGQIGLGIDHSAITVASAEASLFFYRGLGLEEGHHGLNEGSAQDHLDGLDDVRVDVIPMKPAGQTPHVELLGYHRPHPPVAPWHVNDVVATRIVWRGRKAGLLRDPDGHLHQVQP